MAEAFRPSLPVAACRQLKTAVKKSKNQKIKNSDRRFFADLKKPDLSYIAPRELFFQIVTRLTVNLAETGNSLLPAPFACATFDVPKCADTRLATTRQVLTDDWKHRFWQERHKQWAKYGGPQSFPDNWLIYEFAIYETFKGTICTFVAGANWLFVISAGY